MARFRWTKEKVQEIANLCKTREEMKKKYSGAYQAAIKKDRLNCIEEIFANHKNQGKTKIEWNQKKAILELTAYSNKKYGKNFYTFEKVIYKGYHKNIEIFCTKHKKYFKMRFHSFLKNQVSCSQCETEKRRKSGFKNKIKAIKDLEKFSDKEYGKGVYTFEKAIYKGVYKPIEIYCTIHKKYFNTTTPHNFKKKSIGCTQCISVKQNKDAIEAIKDLENYSIKKHGINAFTFEKAIYKNALTPIIIYCTKHKKYFNTTNPHNFLQGVVGCPNCLETGFKPNKPAYFYIYGRPDGYLKYGIGENAKTRMKTDCKEAEMLYMIHCEDGKVIQNIENSIKKSKRLITNQAKKDGKFFAGYTETTVKTNKAFNILVDIAENSAIKQGYEVS